MTATAERMDYRSTETKLAELSQEEREAALDGLDPQALEWSWDYKGRPDQLRATRSESPTTVFIGGRGAGKTRCGSEWIRDKIDHTTTGRKLRFALCSRTTADVRDTMINGDSGLMTVFPESQRPTYIGHLRIIRFYDGSEGLCFSSQEPDQLRGPQFHYCFPAGTQIRTPTSERSIEDIKVGEMVVTRYGPRRVKRVGYRQSTLVRMTHSKGVLVGSPEHPVWTTRGWIRLDSLLPTDILFTWVNGPSHDKGGTSDQTIRTVNDASSFAVAGSGNNTTDRYQREARSTITTMTKRTIGSKTWNVILLVHTPESTRRSFESVNASIAARNTKFQHGAVAIAPADARGAKVGTHGVEPKLSLGVVHNASRNIRLRTQTANTAVSRAATPLANSMYPATQVGIDWLKSPANGAAPNEWPDERSASVVSGVEIVQSPPATVYNLEVDEHPEFFADGVLVHNSLADELAAWEHKRDDSGLTAWDNLQIATRLGDKPQIFASTTPRRVPAVRELYDRAAKPGGGVELITGASTFDNPYLSAAYMQTMLGLYEGTRLSQQELYGILLGDVEGALWSMEQLDMRRVERRAMETPLIVIGVDPSVSEKPRDECGIVIACATKEKSALRRHAYVIDDRSVLGPPSVWAKAVVQAARDFKAPVVAERNQGGALIRESIHTVDPTIRVRTVHARVNKRLRAEPVTLAYDQGRVHHAGRFAALEDQMTTWVPEDTDSPDRLDALVYALSALVVPSSYRAGIGMPTVRSSADRRVDLGPRITPRRRVL